MKRFPIIALCCALPLLAPDIPAQSLPLDECQRLKSRIDRLTARRRGGGSAVQMERWKQQRETLSDRYRAHFCHKYGRRLSQR